VKARAHVPTRTGDLLETLDYIFCKLNFFPISGIIDLVLLSDTAYGQASLLKARHVDSRALLRPTAKAADGTPFEPKVTNRKRCVTKIDFRLSTLGASHRRGEIVQ
jgi:hypothetical protein